MFLRIERGFKPERRHWRGKLFGADFKPRVPVHVVVEISHGYNVTGFEQSAANCCACGFVERGFVAGFDGLIHFNSWSGLLSDSATSPRPAAWTLL
jgi:hypothetical protein